MNRIKTTWQNNPLTLIIWLAIILRLIAAIFSKGFGMHDDHFLVIEPAQAWIDNYNYNNWLPGSVDKPSGHSFFYVGIHYLIFSVTDWFNFTDAQGKMLLIRILHAFYSLITVVVGFKIVERLANKKVAAYTGLLLAVFWFIPFLSVRNLVEVVCIPPMIYGIWLIIKSENKSGLFRYFFWAGFMLGLAFSIRFQTLVFTGGVGLALLFQKKFKETLILAMGVILSIFLVQGIIDLFIWGYPFAELTEYIRYNMTHAYDYNVIAWYSYILLVVGILVPPISIFIIFGFFRNWKRNLVILLPTLLFFIFHSAFPNKQERFILPVIPFILILGMMGWYGFIEKSKFWKNNRQLLKACWFFFWVINLILLPVISTMYSKRARVESMTYLSNYKNVEYIVLEDTNHEEAKMSPRYYLEKWTKERDISQNEPLAQHIKDSALVCENSPCFILFFEEKNLDNRVEAVKEIVPGLVYETTIQPGFIDKVMHWLNPVNANQTIHIYRNRDKIPESIVE